MSDPNLPLILLQRGPWQAEIFDPRPDPAALGARFVHGGWVRSLRCANLTLTGRCDENWLAFDGIGLPETFESGLGRDAVEVGDEYLRVGAGRIRRPERALGEREALARLSTIVRWEIETTADQAVFRTRDILKGLWIGYELERRIQLLDDGLCSTTQLRVFSGGGQGQAALSWYAHPFFAHEAAHETGYRLPQQCQPILPPAEPGRERAVDVVCGADGLWRHQRPNSREVLSAWGLREAIQVHLAQGRGVVSLELDRPLDHLVLWANQQVASPEPKWSRVWQHGELATWSIRYRLRPSER